MSTPTLLVHNAILLTCDPAGTVHAPGWLTVGADGRISGVGPGTPPQLESGSQLDTGMGVVDVGGALVGPGFVSAHNHLMTSGSRGLAAGERLHGWADALAGDMALADAEDIYWFVLHGALDCLQNGVTTVYDFADGLMPMALMSGGTVLADPEIRSLAYAVAQVEAKADGGLRFVHSILLEEELGSPSENLDRLEALLVAGAGVGGERHLADAVSGAVSWTKIDGTAELEVAAMRRFGLINQAHFLETAWDVEGQRERFAWYRDAGALGPDFLFAHFVHATPAMVDEVAAADSRLVWLPASNGRLGSGIADVVGWQAHGVTVGLGLDDQACTDIADPWQNLRIGLYTQRASREDPGVLSVAQALEMHTLGAAQTIGVADHVGSLEVGKCADFLVVDPTTPDIGPITDPVASYVLACGLRNLAAVYVGGRLVARDGAVTTSLGAEARREVHRRLAGIRAARAPRSGEVPG